MRSDIEKKNYILGKKDIEEKNKQTKCTN